MDKTSNSAESAVASEIKLPLPSLETMELLEAAESALRAAPNVLSVARFGSPDGSFPLGFSVFTGVVWYTESMGPHVYLATREDVIPFGAEGRLITFV